MSNKKRTQQTQTNDMVISQVVTPTIATSISSVTNDVPTPHLAAPIKVKYKPGAHKLERIAKGDWIDLYTYEDVTLAAGEFAKIDLGFVCQLPQGFEANIAPRSSTFGKFGVLQPNSPSVIDSSFCGDTDYWMYPVYATRDVYIPAGTRLCQFRINQVQPVFEFEEVETLGNPDRGSFGSTGV